MTNAILDQLDGKKVVCIKAKDGCGIRVGDRCVKTKTHYVPLIRLYNEGMAPIPFNPLSPIVIDAEGFEFVSLYPNYDEKPL
jgi:hypothetical protein